MSAEIMTFDNYGIRGVEKETVLAIEYQPDEDGKLRPFQVFTTGGGYDFEYSKTYAQTYWHNSSNSSPYLNPVRHTKGEPRCAFWRASGVEVGNGRIKRRLLTDLAIRRMGFTVLAEPVNGNPFDDAEGEMPTIYCSRCKDHLPDDSDNPCKHIWFCEKCHQQSAPGERCKHRRPA